MEITRYEYERRTSGLLVAKRPALIYHFWLSNPDGSIADERFILNLVTRVGIAQLFNAAFKNSPTSPWYIGIIKGAVPVFTTADTMASHGGWTEIASSDVTDSVRQTWTPGAIASGGDTVSVNSSGSPAAYHLNASLTLQGLFLVDQNTIGGGTGNLYSEAAFSAPVSGVAGQIASVTGQVQLTAG
jgi:hypothetical protein